MALSTGYSDQGENNPTLIAINLLIGIYAVRNWGDVSDKLEPLCQRVQKVFNDFIAVTSSASSQDQGAVQSLSRLFEVFFDAFSVARVYGQRGVTEDLLDLIGVELKSIFENISMTGDLGLMKLHLLLVDCLCQNETIQVL